MKEAQSRTELQRLTTDVAQDRQALRGIMQTLDVSVQTWKVLGAWGAEKVGRLKSNGEWLRRSPLSDLVELEGLSLAVQGKATGFRALRRLAETEPRLDTADLDRLIDRAERQAHDLEQLRLQTADRIFAASGSAED